ncbi:MAG: hypothetical protein DRG59_08820, partial [Deltaproteobacteria bacterium]
SGQIICYERRSYHLSLTPFWRYDKFDLDFSKCLPKVLAGVILVENIFTKPQASAASIREVAPVEIVDKALLHLDRGERI